MGFVSDIQQAMADYLHIDIWKKKTLSLENIRKNIISQVNIIKQFKFILMIW